MYVLFICVQRVHTEVKIGLYICSHSGYMSMHKFSYVLYVCIIQNNTLEQVITVYGG